MSVGVAKAMFAAVSIIFGAWATSYAQARIGSAGAGTIAEKPETAPMIIFLEALPELIVVLSFVVAFLIISLVK